MNAGANKSGHGAFTLVDVVPDVGEKVASVTYHGDFLYVGTGSGKLHMYRVAGTTTAAGKTDYRSERVTVVECSKKGPVVQLEAVPDINILLVLADGAMSMYDLDSLKKRPSGLLDQKNVQSFTLNVRGFFVKHRLCVCVASSKKRLFFYDWADGQYAKSLQRELDLPDVPKSVVYWSGRVFLGYNREYNILDGETGDVQDLFSRESVGIGGRETRPLIKYLPGERFLIVTSDNLGIVVTSKGEPAPVPTTSFSHPPISIAYCYPYMISVSDASGKMEVHAARSSTGRLGAGGKDEIVQSIDIPHGAIGACATLRLLLVS
jgi:hypothetical protein